MVIFPPESLYELRRGLLAKSKSGEITEADAYRQALEADPNDALSAQFLGNAAFHAGDLDEAERLARISMRNHPSAHQPYILLSEILMKRGADAALLSGYGTLALEKLTENPDALEEIDLRRLFPNAPHVNELKQEVLQQIIANEAARDLHESPEVAAELEPHRLIQDLRDAGEEGLDEEFIDDFLTHAEGCAPMLLGILKEYGEDQIHEEDDAMVLHALAILGEIGDPAFLPALAEFLELEDDRFDAVARWAVQRIGFRKPAESLEVIRATMARADKVTQAALATVVARLPHTPGRMEVVASILEGIEKEPPDEQEALAVSAITSAWIMQGSNSPQGGEWMSRYQHLLTPDTRKELKKLRAALAVPVEISEDPHTIYQICGEDLAAGKPFVKEYTPGRNDPCWCGSGQKYKKCHLDADQGR